MSQPIRKRVDERPLSEPWQWLDRALCTDIRRTARGCRRGNPTLKGDDQVLIIENQEHFDKVREFARSIGADAELQKRLDFLAGFGDPAKVRCRLYSDFAPHSFFWRIEYSSPQGWKPGLVGGLIYSGPGAPSDGSAPSFSVSLNPDAATGRKHMWSIHT